MKRVKGFIVIVASPELVFFRTLVLRLYRHVKIIVAKALDGQRYPLPLSECMWMCDGERGSGPEGADDLC